MLGDGKKAILRDIFDAIPTHQHTTCLNLPYFRLSDNYLR